MIEPDLLELRGGFSSSLDAELDLNITGACLLVLVYASGDGGTAAFGFYIFLIDGLLASILDHVAITLSDSVIK